MSDTRAVSDNSDDIAILLAAAHTRRWIEQFVVALNLCPFAAPVVRANQIRIAVCDREVERELAAAVLDELDRLQRAAENELPTSVLVFARALTDFEDYLDFLALAEALLRKSGLDGVVQIASFHPYYQFHGTSIDDVANFTNRSPYPMLHFIREAAVSRALQHYPAPEQIPQRNIAQLQTLGNDAVQRLLKRIEANIAD